MKTLIILTINILLFAQNIQIYQKPIIFNQQRVELTKEYIKKHYNLEVNDITITPKIILIHWSGVNTLRGTFKRFNPTILLNDRLDIINASALNVSAHFIIDRDGKIYQLMNETFMARHVIGLNYNSIGIENVGGENNIDNLTAAQLKSNELLSRYLKKKYPTIEYIIGHYEYKTMQNNPLWLEIDKSYRTNKDDPGYRFLNILKHKLKDLNLKNAVDR